MSGPALPPLSKFSDNLATSLNLWAAGPETKKRLSWRWRTTAGTQIPLFIVSPYEKRSPDEYE